MSCKICGSVLHYHTAGLTCRSCGFSIDHQFLSEVICQSCHNSLDESEKTAGICVSCMYGIVKPAATKELSLVPSIPAIKRIRGSEDKQISGITEVLYGAENAVGRGVQFMKNVEKKMDIFFDSKAPSIVVEIEAYRNGYEDIRNRGGKIRAFTEITKDNIHYCKELMKLVDELRHMEEMKQFKSRLF